MCGLIQGWGRVVRTLDSGVEVFRIQTDSDLSGAPARVHETAHPICWFRDLRDDALVHHFVKFTLHFVLDEDGASAGRVYARLYGAVDGDVEFSREVADSTEVAWELVFQVL